MADTLSSGAPLTPSAYAALFEDPALFDDRELTEALLQRRAPRPAEAAWLERHAPAIAIASRAGPARAVSGLLDRPPERAMLRRNPLYVGESPSRRTFPSPRYAAEYGELASYPVTVDAPREILAAEADAALVRRRVLLDLPARW